jgi:hypothetical protein
MRTLANTTARIGQYALVNVLGEVMRVTDRVTGTAGAEVYRMTRTGWVRVFGL